MSVPDAAPRQPLRLRSAADFFAALRSPDIGTRVGVLRAIAQAPEKALAFGRFQGGDIIDALIHQAYQRQGYSNWRLTVSVLAAFRDPRVVEHFKKILMTWRKPEPIRMAAARLAQEPLAGIEAALRPLLAQTDCLAQTRAAADLLLRSPSLAAAEAIRASVANTQGVSVAPALKESNAALWIAELHGRFADATRQLLETQGEGAFQVLKRQWSALDTGTREWWLAWGVSRWPLATVEPLADALQSESEALVLAALRSVERLGASAALFRGAVSQLVRHANPQIRLAAVHAGAIGIDWRQALRDSDVRFVQACAARLAAEEGVRCVSNLVALLGHTDWQVRATATRLLVQIGEPAVAQIEPLIASPSVETRVAATQVLVELGHQEWLEEHLLS